MPVVMRSYDLFRRDEAQSPGVPNLEQLGSASRGQPTTVATRSQRQRLVLVPRTQIRRLLLRKVGL